jgi:thiol-disulfide isomerase/thioredoxin
LTTPIITEDDNITIDVKLQLQANQYVEDLSKVKIVGDWNNFKLADANELTKQDDGTYVYVVESDQDEVAYQLFGADVNGHTINGTMSDRLEYDGGGDYKSIIKTKDGKARIVFDPAKIKRLNNPPEVEFPNNKTLAVISEIDQKTTSDKNKYYEARSTYSKKHKTTEGFSYNFNKLTDYLEDKMNSSNPLVQRYAAIRYVSIINSGYENGDVQKVVKLLPVSDPFWAINSFSLRDIYKNAYGKEKADDIIAKNFNNIKSKNVRAKILAMQGIEAKENDNMKKAGEIYNILSSEYNDQSDIRWYVSQIDPNKVIAKGKPVPDFNVKLLHSDETVSKESMLGKYYMIDFWAVWCGPCRAEMPKLHEAYNEFKNSNFTILSLSFDNNTDVVDKYRKETWAMPWLHSFVEGGFRNELSKRFEVMGIPKPLLVNPEGIIIATETELRGENLRKTLEKYLSTSM